MTRLKRAIEGSGISLESSCRGRMHPTEATTASATVRRSDETFRRRMEGSFAAIERLPHVSEVESPYGGGGGAVSENGEIAFATVQFDQTGDDLDSEEVKRAMDAALGASGGGLGVGIGGAPIEEVRGEEEEDDLSFKVGLGAAVIVLLLTFGSAVAMGLPIVSALFALGVGLSLVTLGTQPLRGRDGGRLRGADDDGRGADAAAGAADDRGPLGRPPAHPRPRRTQGVHRRGHALVPLEPRDPTAAGDRGAARRLRPRLQRPVPDRGSAAR